ncbi:Cullin-domain-containing protein [Sistotremastrum suecicum HHB10207 ss-3]|uniref:Cullin-domain-containing protein n=1 Tax=Sistotremastrum suecicum HHB10207 ss-3 TaxID=1314776 RepID=A0A166ALE9_9AGAM|nr:Cullin-domain-containing protein [Sistotremastrum suecicum HHB10207 ss-3]
MALERCVVSIAADLRNKEDEGLPALSSIVDIWSWFNHKVNLLRTILVELDRGYLMEKHLPGVRELGYTLWRKNIYEDALLASRVIDGIVAWSSLERNTSLPQSRPLIQSLIESLRSLAMYNALFEETYVSQTIDFYTAESADRESDLSPREFLAHAEKRVKEEEARCQDLLPKPTMIATVSATERCLWGNHASALAKKAIVPLLDSHDTDGIKQMYRLFARVDSLKVMRKAYQDHLSVLVMNTVKEPKGGDENMIQLLLNIKAFCDGLTKEFHDRELGYATTKAFEKGFAGRSGKPAEMIAKYIDSAMRKGQRGASDADFRSLLENVLILYRFTPDKDVFRTFYSRGLAKRLLLSRSASDDLEKEVIKILREDYDPEFGKGDEMFKDLALSRDLVEEFRRAAKSMSDVARALSVSVLQYSSWPIAQKKKTTRNEIDLPSDMQSALTQFSEFYKSKHGSRKLDWFHSLGTVTMTARFKNGTKELTLSLYQAVVLRQFTRDERLQYDDVKAATGLDDRDLKITLQSLACGKKRVLRKLPPGREVEGTDSFIFNQDFTDPKRNLQIPGIQQQETVEENKQTTEHIEEDRKFYLDAAIVRIMKAKKSLPAEKLKTETIDAVKAHFRPSVTMIKQRIENLVEQEYIRRDDDDMNIYVYVA